ncbi:MAG: endonuclease/exonuclease/phosphatase family protein [Myxococcaceae bacterium]
MAGPLRIVSYNVRYFGHALRGLASTQGPKRRISAALLGLSPLPDVICLQEVETISLRARIAHRTRTPQETQLEAFMGRLEQAFQKEGKESPYEAFYFRAHTYQLRKTPLYTTGLAILVNSKTLQVDSHNVEKPEAITHHHVERWKDRKQSRICAHIQMKDAEGRKFHVFNTHLSLPTPFAKEFWSQSDKMGHGVNQMAEAKTLSGFIHRHAGNDPFVVCGDFNSPPGSPVYRYLTEEAKLCGAQEKLKLIDANQSRGFPTAGFMRLRMHLDHVFCGGPVSWVDCEGTCAFGDPKSPFYGLSDHMPMVARFQLEGA